MSSRRHIPGIRDDYEVVVGWDNPLMTFFARVEGRRGPSDRQGRELMWVGTNRSEILTVERLSEVLRPYATLSPAMLDELRRDRAKDADRGPTALQRMFV